ncbi:MAG: helix-turn-helix domain-containing protein [Rhodoblastus sp.]|nr:helix-turn-helix domain-containing protein [Rhodoblastus sp.]MCO5087166.1 helix-turn-helix domain-containing protein [Methylobacteriaceae bacterium]
MSVSKMDIYVNRDFAMKARLQRNSARDNSLIISFGFNQYLMEMSRLVTQRFEGDTDSYFILAAISVASIGHVLADPAKARRYGSINTRIEEDYAYIRLLPLAEITGMPRTTVRRKVATLMALGYVEHDPKHGYRVVKGSMANCPHLRQIMQAQITLMLRLFNVMLGGALIELRPAESRHRKLASVGKPIK